MIPAPEIDGDHSPGTSRAQLVLIREIHPHSFLVLTTRGDGFCLRDFSAETGPAIEVTRQTPGRGTTQILEMARQPGNHLIPAANPGIKDYDYWHGQTIAMNDRYLAPPPPPPVIAVPGWLREHIAQVVVTVVGAVLTAVILAWLKLKS